MRNNLVDIDRESGDLDVCEHRAHDLLLPLLSDSFIFE
jgi:hypothetical protein